MNQSSSGRHLMGGTVQIFLAEALLLPTGILTAAFLTRQLGPDDYGLYTLAATLIGWVGWSITSIFTRATIKFVGEAADWHPIGVVVLRLHLLLGVGTMLLLWLLAQPIATLLGEPTIASYLWLFALDIPLFCLAYVHRSILVGIGGFTQRAIASAGRWIARLLLIVLFVALGFSVPGAILGSVGASLVELAISRLYVRPALFGASTFPMRQLWSYAVPLFLFALSMRLYEKLDLFALKILGGTAAQVGFYGAAQNLSLIPGIFSLAFAPLLLSSLTRTLYNGDYPAAKQIGRNAMRIVFGMVPFAGLMAGAAPEIVTLIFSETFLPTAPLLAWLIFAALALALISVTTAILTAAGKPNWTFTLTGPLVPLAIAADWLIIPQQGAIGAAWVTTGVASLGALATLLAVYRLWHILPAVTTLGRSIFLCILAYILASLWPTTGVLLLFKLSLIGLLIPLVFLLLGEFNSHELKWIQSFIRSGLNTFRKRHPSN
jgi:O-antigen/teichoic acid export membrane protein